MAIDSGYDRTQVMPTDWGAADQGYVKDTDEWVERCLARVMALDVVLKTEEARPIVLELSTRDRWRVLAPEAAAEQLYQKPKGGTAEG
jgi:hypothetical protein